MTELVCTNGHVLNPGESVCLRCGSAVDAPIVPETAPVSTKTGPRRASQVENPTDETKPEDVKTDEVKE